jgi:hypothetical protein
MSLAEAAVTARSRSFADCPAPIGSLGGFMDTATTVLKRRP